MAEEDCQLETCYRIARAEDGGADPTIGNLTSQGREVFAYHGGIDSTTILGEALSHHKPRQFVRLMVRNSQKAADPSLGTDSSSQGKSAAYLRSVGAFDIPPFTTW